MNNRTAVQEINENRKVFTENFIVNVFSLDTFLAEFFLSLLILPVFYSICSRKMLNGLINF